LLEEVDLRLCDLFFEADQCISPSSSSFFSLSAVE